MAIQPKLLLLDEIAGGLTEYECGELVKTIKEIHARGTTIVWIEHIVHALVSVASRLIVMNFGQILAQGDPHEVMAECPRARSLHGHPGVMTLLQTQNLSAFYGDFQALFDINVTVEEGETVAIIGANGAGKTTFLRAVAGALDTAPDMVLFDGQPIGHNTPHEIVRLGIAMVPEGRRLFPSLSVEENLLLGGHSERRRAVESETRL